MLSQTETEAVADALLEAERTRVQIGLVSVKHPDITLDDAYAIQTAQIARKLASGRQIIGWKIGLTSRAMQDALGITTPDSGVLYDDMLFANGAVIPENRFIQPRVEAEIAFRLKKTLPADPTRDDILAATEAVMPSIEILDTRITRTERVTGQARKVFDTIADNAANAGIVLGDKEHDPQEFDLRWVGAIVHKDDEVVATGLGAGVLNDPVTGIVWLARRMAIYGQRLEAGQIVLSGSFIAPIECPPGTRILADFGSFGTVSTSFA